MIVNLTVIGPCQTSLFSALCLLCINCCFLSVFREAFLVPKVLVAANQMLRVVIILSLELMEPLSGIFNCWRINKDRHNRLELQVAIINQVKSGYLRMSVKRWDSLSRIIWKGGIPLAFSMIYNLTANF